MMQELFEPICSVPATVVCRGWVGLLRLGLVETKSLTLEVHFIMLTEG